MPSSVQTFTYIMSIHLKDTTFLSFNLLLNTKKLGLRKTKPLTNATQLVSQNSLYLSCNIYDLNQLPQGLHDHTELDF